MSDRSVSGQNGYDDGPEDSEGERKGGTVGRREMRNIQTERDSETETGERNRNRERDRQIEALRDRQNFPHLPLLTPSLSPVPPHPNDPTEMGR